MYTNRLILIRPHFFHLNLETMDDNQFQAKSYSHDNISKNALLEFDHVIEQLEKHKIEVKFFDDHDKDRPDSVFPNNWFSTHNDGTIVIYPMYSINRRKEVRLDIIDYLCKNFTVNRKIDLTKHVAENKYLEGTGSIIFDHFKKNAFMAISKRSNEELFKMLCTELNYNPIILSPNENILPVYHTNVILSINENFIFFGSDYIKNGNRIFTEQLQGNRDIIFLSKQEINDFAGNVLLVGEKNNRKLLMSKRAFINLTKEKIKKIESKCEIITFSIPSIEHSGGSIRCMLAENYLPPK